MGATWKSAPLFEAIRRAVEGLVDATIDEKIAADGSFLEWLEGRS